MSSKYLKSLKRFPLALNFGRDDLRTVVINPDDAPLAYSVVVDENEESPTYNKFIIDAYINDNILVIITLPDVVIPETTVVITSPI